MKNILSDQNHYYKLHKQLAETNGIIIQIKDNINNLRDILFLFLKGFSIKKYVNIEATIIKITTDTFFSRLPDAKEYLNNANAGKCQR